MELGSALASIRIDRLTGTGRSILARSASAYRRRDFMFGE